MKKLTLLFLTFISTLFYACKSDTPNEVGLLGIWNLTTFKTANTSDINQDGNSTNDLMAETDYCYRDNNLIFRADNTVDLIGSIANIVITNTNGTLTITSTCEGDNGVESYHWTQSGNTITVTDVGIGVISGNTLTFTIPAGYNLPSIDGGVEAHTLTDIVQVFTKQ